MQFEVLFTLICAALAVAHAIPRDNLDTSSLPSLKLVPFKDEQRRPAPPESGIPPTNTPPPPLPANTDLPDPKADIYGTKTPRDNKDTDNLLFPPAKAELPVSPPQSGVPPIKATPPSPPPPTNTGLPDPKADIYGTKTSRDNQDPDDFPSPPPKGKFTKPPPPESEIPPPKTGTLLPRPPTNTGLPDPEVDVYGTETPRSNQDPDDLPSPPPKGKLTNPPPPESSIPPPKTSTPLPPASTGFPDPEVDIHGIKTPRDNQDPDDLPPLPPKGKLPKPPLGIPPTRTNSPPPPPPANTSVPGAKTPREIHAAYLV